MTENERVATLEQKLTDHLIECNKAARRNDEAHKGIMALLSRMNTRLWGLILALLIAAVAVIGKLTIGS